MNWRSVWTVVREAVKEFSEDDALAQAAALAYYTALGLAPTIMLFLSVAAFLGEGTREQMIAQIGTLAGEQAGKGIDLVVRSAEAKPASGVLSAIVGTITLLFSATGIFAQLQSTLNHIWNVQPKATASGYWGWIRARLLSAGLLVAGMFLLLVSLVVSTIIAFLLPQTGALWDLVTLAISIGVFIVLFAAIFKFLPDVEMAWRDVWIGAALTAVLFALGKYLIGLYLGQSSVASSYGAAGSLVALLVWVYYSAAIVFFGAEVTQVIAKHLGAGIRPAPHAIPEDGTRLGKGAAAAPAASASASAPAA